MPCTSFVSSRLQTSKFCCPFYLLLIKIDQPNLQLMLSNTLALKSIFAIYNAQCSDDWISSRGNRKRHCRIGFYIQISSITLQHDDFTTVLSSYVLVWYFSVRGTSLRLMRPVWTVKWLSLPFLLMQVLMYMWVCVSMYELFFKKCIWMIGNITEDDWRWHTCMTLWRDPTGWASRMFEYKL